MHSCSSCVNSTIPEEYRRTAEALFPAGGFPPEKERIIAAAGGFADILGIGADYRHVLSMDPAGGEMRRFLGHFQNNLDLLIQKTWVERADEIRKEKLLDRIPGFIAKIEGRDEKALGEFGAILAELAYLFFGAQSAKDDFTEYTFRIDTQMGLFWWYGGHLGCLTASPGFESLWAVLLIGICYLTNF